MGKMKKNKLFLATLFIFSIFLSSCGFTIDDLLFDYNSYFDKTETLRFIDNGEINPKAIIQDEVYEIKKDKQGGKNLIITAPSECEAFEWKVNPDICSQLNIQTNLQSLTLPIDLMNPGEYTVRVTVFYKSQGYSDSCIVRVHN